MRGYMPVALLTLTALAACSTPPPTFGERLTSEGSEVRSLGEDDVDGHGVGAGVCERARRLAKGEIPK